MLQRFHEGVVLKRTFRTTREDCPLNQPQRFYKTLLGGRARGNQPLRTNPPRAPKDDGKLLVEIAQLAAKSEQELGRCRFASSAYLLSKALKLARSLEDQKLELVDELAKRKAKIDDKIEKLRKRTLRAISQALPA